MHTSEARRGRGRGRGLPKCAKLREEKHELHDHEEADADHDHPPKPHVHAQLVGLASHLQQLHHVGQGDVDPTEVGDVQKRPGKLPQIHVLVILGVPKLFLRLVLRQLHFRGVKGNADREEAERHAGEGDHLLVREPVTHHPNAETHEEEHGATQRGAEHVEDNGGAIGGREGAAQGLAAQVLIHVEREPAHGFDPAHDEDR
eukprot:scaffold1220_cov259-Pinguiococcus_pyrenoidosus.AAC.143